MVLLKRLDYGFIGYQFPPTPRATRSVRRRRSSFRKKKSDNDDQMCAFDLLATVAGKLLSDGENSNSPKEHSSTVTEPTVKRILEQEEEGPVRAVTSDQGSCNSRFYAPEDAPKIPNCGNSPNESSAGQNDDCCGFASVVTSVCSDKVVNPEKLVADNKVETHLLSISCNYTKDDAKRMINAVVDEKPPGLVSLDNNTHILQREDDDVNLVVRDDDENSSGCTQQPRRGIIKACRPSLLHNGDRRIRKLLGSRCRKLHNSMRDDGNPDTHEETKANRNNLYKRQRSQRDYPFKKRKIYSESLSNSDKEEEEDAFTNKDGFSNSPIKGLSGSGSASGSPVQGGGGGASTWKTNNQNMSFKSRDSSHVRLRIKSFKVPEFFIEIPETATVGSLKRTVLEALTAILGSGLKVGVLVQGKKIRDDNKTLLQTGISHDNDRPDALGFSLEPTSPQAATTAENSFSLKNEPPFMLPPPSCEPPPKPRYQSNNVVPFLTRLGSFVESDHDSAPSPPDMLSSLDNKNVGSYNKDSKAVVPVVATDVKALSVVPMRKMKRPEVAQRRIRRPFSVAEVEALVQAVEKLGTGRWRDVKLRAFDNAKHRTYVDLKDKWKTLVHTARISPQQRRGEPVPQELLDRVLVAHSYWSQYQPKQHLKHQHEEGVSCGLLLL